MDIFHAKLTPECLEKAIGRVAPNFEVVEHVGGRGLTLFSDNYYTEFEMVEFVIF